MFCAHAPRHCCIITLWPIPRVQLSIHHCVPLYALSHCCYFTQLQHNTVVMRAKHFLPPPTTTPVAVHFLDARREYSVTTCALQLLFSLWPRIVDPHLVPHERARTASIDRSFGACNLSVCVRYGAGQSPTEHRQSIGIHTR